MYMYYSVNRNSNFVCNKEFCTIEGVHNNEHILYMCFLFSAQLLVIHNSKLDGSHTTIQHTTIFVKKWRLDQINKGLN